MVRAGRSNRAAFDKAVHYLDPLVVCELVHDMTILPKRFRIVKWNKNISTVREIICNGRGVMLYCGSVLPDPEFPDKETGSDSRSEGNSMRV